MAVFLGGEAVGEDFVDVVRVDAHAIVFNRNPNSGVIVFLMYFGADADSALILGIAHDGVLGVGEKVDEDLEDGVLVAEKGGRIGKFAHDADVIGFE